MTSWTNDGQNSFQREYEIATVLKHEQFNSQTLENDIALLGLKTEVVLSESVKLAKLMPIDVYLLQRKNYQFFGWEYEDQSKQFHRLSMNLEPLETCQKALNSVGMKMNYHLESLVSFLHVFTTFDNEKYK